MRATTTTTADAPLRDHVRAGAGAWALAASLLCVLLAIPAAATAEPGPGVHDLATSARVVHAGSRFPITFEIEPEEVKHFGRDRDEDVIVLGLFEKGGKFGRMQPIGTGSVTVGPKGKKGAKVEATVPVQAQPGRLHYTVARKRRLPSLPVLDPTLLATIGEVRSIDVVEAPNLAITSIELPDAPAAGAAAGSVPAWPSSKPLRVKWTATRTTPGPTGPAAVRVGFASGDATRESPAPVDVTWPEGLPDGGTISGEVVLRPPLPAGLFQVTARIRYEGEVSSPADDDGRATPIKVEGAQAPVPEPVPAPGTPSPAPPPPGPPTPEPAEPAPAPGAPETPTPPPARAAGVRAESVTFAPTPATPGQVLEVTLELRNVGSMPDTRSVGRVVLVDATGTDVDLATIVRAGALRAGATGRVQAKATLPATLAPGVYRVAVRMGNAGSQPSDLDGLAAASLEVKTVPLPDLTVKILSPPTAPVEAGQVLSVACEVMNRGQGPASKVVVSLLLVGDGEPKLLDEIPVAGPLAPGSRATGRLRFEVPADAAAGRARLQVEVDRARQVPETDDTNNVAVTEVTVGAALSNLSVASLEAKPATVAAGGRVKLEAVVRNEGKRASTATKVAFSAMGGRGTAPLELGSAPVGAIEPGAEARVLFATTVPAGAPARAWGLVARVDPDDVVPESDENDDTLVVAGGLTTEPAASPAPPGSDPVLVEMAGPEDATLSPAGRVAVRVAIRNRGRDVAPPFDVALVLATREAPERRRDGWKGVVGEIARAKVPAGALPGESGPIDIALEGRIPGGLAAGPYFLVAILDPEGRVPISRRVDDVRGKPVRIAAKPMLVALDSALRIFPSDVGGGEPFRVAAVLRNEGNLATPASSLAVVLRAVGPKRRDGFDTPLVTLPLDPVKPGETREVALDVPAPRGLPRGRYKAALRVITPGADPVDVAEGWVGIKTGASGLDLALFDARVRPGRVRAGEGVRVHVRVANLGEGRTPPTVVRLDLTAGPIITPLAEAPVEALAPGESIDVEIPARIPGETGPGPTWLALRLDPERRFSQTDRENDLAWGTVEVRGRYDREVRLAWPEAPSVDRRSLAPGGSVDVAGWIRNAGQGEVGGTEVEALLVDAKGRTRSLGRRPVDATIDAGRSREFGERFEVPLDVAPGPYVLRLLLDPDRRLPWPDGVGSSDVEIPIEVAAGQGRADLAAISLADAGSAGRRLQLTAQVVNRSSSPAPAFTVQLLLVGGDDAHPGLRLPLSVQRVPAGTVPGGSTMTARFDAEIADVVPSGDYRALAVVEVDEGLEAPPRDRIATLNMRVGSPVAPPEPAPAPIVPRVPVPAPVPIPTPAPVVPRPGVPAPPPQNPARQDPAPVAGPSSTLPVALSVLLPGNGLTRERGEPATFVVTYPADTTAPSILEVSLEVEGASYPLGEFDVPDGLVGTSGAVKGRLRLPSTVAVGTGTLLVVVRREGGEARAPLRLSVSVR